MPYACLALMQHHPIMKNTLLMLNTKGDRGEHKFLFSIYLLPPWWLVPSHKYLTRYQLMVLWHISLCERHDIDLQHHLCVFLASRILVLDNKIHRFRVCRVESKPNTEYYYRLISIDCVVYALCCMWQDNVFLIEIVFNFLGGLG